MARRWLVPAVATLCDVAYGTREEDTELAGIAPANLRAPHTPTSTATPARVVRVFGRGLASLRHHLHRGTLWRWLWLLPRDLTAPSPDLIILRHLAPPETAHAYSPPLSEG